MHPGLAELFFEPGLPVGIGEAFFPPGIFIKSHVQLGWVQSETCGTWCGREATRSH